MRWFVRIALILCVTGIHARAQSLAEAARKEAERRRQLEARGVEARVIEGGAGEQGARGGVTTFSADSSRKTAAPRADGTKRSAPVSSLRNLLQKLDREILAAEEKRALLLQQAEAEKWSLPRVGRVVRGRENVNQRERLEKEARELELKIRSLRRQRIEAYEAGRKAGFLPGELDGKGVSP